ncbi:DUF7738 domain-containing protein [Allorhodopirellula solitaria]|uniref:DUF7738 domain-containing protein n=1 Tax=Allorhodopirellula solitaria TaxID=2527987 RepID=A0A5C5XQ19_9BACT|nr:hypothetical protein [Allorhodopirellula solitaria]TWT65010.1 hypothetical protein CA85_33550 [Allorhodopirellula solitaria]
MRRFLSMTVLLVILGCNASHQSEPVTGTQSTAGDAITLSADGIDLLGTSLNFPFTVSEIAKVIGPPDRVSRLANHVSTWDGFGLVVLEESPGDPIVEMDICFHDEDELDFSPKHGFDGIVRYNSVDISSDSKRMDLVSAGFIQDEMLESLYRAEDGDLKMWAEYDNGLVEITAAW